MQFRRAYEDFLKHMWAKLEWDETEKRFYAITEISGAEVGTLLNEIHHLQGEVDELAIALEELKDKLEPKTVPQPIGD